MPYPIDEWLTATMTDIAEASKLPADSLIQTAMQWRKFEDTNLSRSTDIHEHDYDHSRLHVLSQAKVDYYINWGLSGEYDGFYPFENMVPPINSSNKINDVLVNIRPKL